MSKVALITGAARRIGASIAHEFHTAGYRVIVHCNHSLDAANEMAAGFNKSRNDSAVVITQDLAQIGNAEKFFAACLQCFGRVDVLINNASVFYPTPFDRMAPEEFDQFIDTNLKAPLFLVRAGANHLKGGAVINIVDIHGETPLRDYLAYSVSKAGLLMLTKALAIELAPDVRVNGISPGAILWPEQNAEMSANERNNLLEKIPMQTLGTPEDIARTALFLAESSAFITGQIVTVDGGQSI